MSCDPAVCAALEASGFPAGDLMTLGPGARDPLGSAVVVSTAAVRSLFGTRLTTVYAPTVIASFGSGAAQIDVRVYTAGGEPTSPPGAGSGYLASVLAFVTAQRTPYLARSVKTTILAGGREVVRIVFDAPSPLGLLSP